MNNNANINDNNLSNINLKNGDSCSSYQFSWYELILPSKYTFLKLCRSYDKTELFIVSCMRLLIYIMLISLMINWEKGTALSIIFYVLIIWAIINFFVLFGTINKTQLYPKIN
jgi:hypothetical protein